MYSVYTDGKLLYSPKMVKKKYIITEPSATFEDNAAGSFSFKLPHTNPMYDSLSKLKSVITIHEDGEEIFRGRVLHDTKDFFNRKNVYCEGQLSFLLDSVIEPYEYSGSVAGLLEFYLNNHNAKVDEYKKFYLGNVTVTDANDYIVRSNGDCTKTWDEIKSKLIDLLGGHIQVRKENDRYYIDYLDSYNSGNDQIIRFGKNLLDLEEYIDAGEVFTALIPYGATDGETNTRLDITEVNDGKNYIYDETAVSLFGWIWKSEKWDDVTIADNLLSKSKEYLKKGIEMSVTLTLSAVDMHNADLNVKAFRILDQLRVISLPHKLNNYFALTKMVLKLDKPSSNTYTFGTSFKTLTDKSNKMQKQITSSVNIENQVTFIQQTVNNVASDVKKTNDVIVKIDGDYVPTKDFNVFKTEVNNKLTSVYHFKGSVSSYENLPKRGMEIGDVYNIYDTGANYAWTSEGWDKLSETIDLSGYVSIDVFEQLNTRVTELEEKIKNLEENQTKE